MQFQSPETDLRADGRWFASYRPGGWSAPGGGRELLRIAVPLIVSNSVWTLQITLDRVMLSWLGQEQVGAAMTAVMLFWTPLALFQTTAGYSTTFVAQYVGAGRPERVGPAVWQALWFSLVFGIAFLILLPLTETLVSWGDHSPHIQQLEADYFYCLCFSALPTMIVAAASGFFAGRGDSWTVLVINVVGLIVNGILDYLWIFGHGGFPAWGIAGAGWATVCGTGASAALALVLLLQRKYREEFQLLAGWRFDPDLFRRLMRYGLPSGLQWALEGLAWTGFLFMVGRLGDAELAASSIAFTLNAIAFMPTMGIGQAIQVLVGHRLDWAGNGHVLHDGAGLALLAGAGPIPGHVPVAERAGRRPAAASGGHHPGAAALHRRLFGVRRHEPGIRLRAQGRGRHPLRHRGVRGPGLAAPGGAQLGGLAIRLGPLLGLDLCQQLHRGAGLRAVLALSRRSVETDARHRSKVGHGADRRA
jgi:putative MATE family efflux protein